MKYIRRALEERIRQEASTYKTVLVTGARQVGKSTLLKHLFPDIKYVTLDDPFIEEQASENSSMFMAILLRARLCPRKRTSPKDEKAQSSPRTSGK